mgnify:CR=1 FL=1
MLKNGGTGKRAPMEVAHAPLKGGTVANAADSDASFWPAVATCSAGTTENSCVLGEFWKLSALCCLRFSLALRLLDLGFG